MRLIIFHYISILISLSTPKVEKTKKFGNCSDSAEENLFYVLKSSLDNLSILWYNIDIINWGIVGV